MGFAVALPPVRRRARVCSCATSTNRTSASARTRLLDAVRAGVSSGALSLLVANLETEAASALPATCAFTELALTGEWRLVYSSALGALRATAAAARDGATDGGTVRICTVKQRLGEGTMVTEVKFQWDASFLDHTLYGTLGVACEYQLIGATRLRVGPAKHTLQFSNNAAQPPPDRLQQMLAKLQRAIPPQLFDPAGVFDATVLRNDVRVSRVVGGHMAGVRDVYVEAMCEDAPDAFG